MTLPKRNWGKVMAKAKVPVFHIPVGRRWRRNGKVAFFKSDADQADAMDAWMAMTMEHPATLAAEACVIIGPNVTNYVDLRSQAVTQSRTAEGAWQPSALSDWQGAEGGQ
jgi:hypothetical protein